MGGRRKVLVGSKIGRHGGMAKVRKQFLAKEFVPMAAYLHICPIAYSHGRFGSKEMDHGPVAFFALMRSNQKCARTKKNWVPSSLCFHSWCYPWGKPINPCGKPISCWCGVL
jgi:hypothetical protein